MKSIKNMIVVLLVLIFAFSIVGCSNDGKSGSDVDSKNDTQTNDENASSIDTMKRISDGKKVIWGTNAMFSPFEMREGSDVIGIDAEIAKKVAEKLEVELVVEDMEFDSLIAALQSGKIDFIAAGFTIKPDREKQVLFTDTYFKAVQAVIIQDGNDEIKSPSDLEGKKIGVQIDTTGFYEAEDIKDAEVIQFNNGIEAALDLSNGNIDLIIIDNLPAQMLVDSNPDLRLVDFDEKPFEDEEYAMAVRKGDTQLQELVNQVLKEMKDSGEIDKLVNKYSIGE